MSKQLQNGEEIELLNGVTRVKVWRRDINESNKKEVVTLIHEGIVLQQTTKFARVYNPSPISQGGDVSPEVAQFFPIASKCCWLEVAGKQGRPFKIPATM